MAPSMSASLISPAGPARTPRKAGLRTTRTGAVQPARGWWSAIVVAAPALVLASVILLPFLAKAHTADDPVFLRQAEQQDDVGLLLMGHRI